MLSKDVTGIISKLADEYNRECYFENDPIIFPKHFARLAKGETPIFPEYVREGSGKETTLQDIEIAAVIAAHLAWGRRDMIVRDTKRAMDEMDWQPYRYIMNGKFRNDDVSLHRTIRWSEFAKICSNLQRYYKENSSLEQLSADEIRVEIYGQKSNPKMANKKIHMMRRWMVRNDGIVDLGLWKSLSPAQLIIPLDVHVHRSSKTLHLTERNSADFTTAYEITQKLKEIFPEDPCKGDFALFAYAATMASNKKEEGECTAAH